ncbi:MAG TPA: antibiotic biosynthesis monooxygenase [Streptosporangiaceae bacterium]|nr:antibiotic biosynthesis monooxygenase [Streptosporangiaceae bacterium]
MSLPVLVGFAGVLVAAVATGLLAGRCVRQPRIGFIVWTAATLGLTIALAAQSMGFASGFGPATFRAVQLLALLLAPLWLAWGLVELAVGSDAARFGMRLVSAALSVVASVILATDPLTAQPFSKAWPLTGTHFQPVARDALDVVQVVAVAVAVVIAGLAAVRAGRDSGPAVDSGSARDSRLALTAVVPVALAVLMTAGQRFPLPAKVAYPLLSIVAAALVWFAVSRVGELPRRAAGDGRGEGMRDRRDKPGDEYWPDDRAAGEYAPEGQYVTYGQGRPGSGGPRGDFPGGPAGRGVPDSDRGRRPGPQPRPPERPYRGSGPGGPREPAADEWPGTQAVPLPGSEAGVTESGLAGAASLAGSPAAAAARPYGRILIFTLLEDRVTDFDRLAEEAAEYVRTGEPDTLVYVIHLVPNAPLQRIFYEIYRDRAAFDSHESQPYMQRFVAERRTCVLATNVIELRLKYAKVAPLPGPQPPAPVPVAPLPAAPSRGVPGAPVPQRARPLPPPRPQRSDQTRSDQPRYGRPRYEQPAYAEPGYDRSRDGRERYDERRPDQRQIPSGRPYGG